MTEQTVKLVRAVGFWGLVAMCINAVVGSGVFSSPPITEALPGRILRGRGWDKTMNVECLMVNVEWGLVRGGRFNIQDSTFNTPVSRGRR